MSSEPADGVSVERTMPPDPGDNLHPGGRAEPTGPGASEAPLVTILVCTYQRASDLAEMLDSAIAQKGVSASDYEILVVDNNSSDDTYCVVADRMARFSPGLRYLFEGRQGKSYALNTGVAHARGTYYAVVDDDLIMPSTYVRDLLHAISEAPDVAAFGGKVLPLYGTDPPAWLTSDQWAPIAMADLGNEPFPVGAARQVCFMAATLRRADVLAVGGYRIDLGVRGRHVIGGTEDAELMQRLWRAGLEGRYMPQLVLHHKVPPSRLTRSHFRRWNFGHGRSRAIERDPAVEQGLGRLFDVPLHMYRAAAGDLSELVRHLLKGHRDEAFHRELRLLFFAGFLAERLSSWRRS